MPIATRYPTIDANITRIIKIFNVSQKRSDLGRANSGAVVELGWPDQLAPALDKLCSICKQFETWLMANPDNLLVVHCKGG